jgi:RNA polymerase sigma-70 factor (ECF subfamily)
VRRQEERLLLDALRAIPLDYQIVLELAFFEDMSRSQIAETLGLPAGTVASRLRKARELLRSEIEAIAQSPELLEATVTGVDDWARNVRETLEGEATSSEDHPAT